MAKIKVKKTKPMKVAYVEHVGEYGKVPWDEYMGKLFAWAKEHKVRPGFKGIGIYYDNPEEKPPEECRSEIAIPIKGEAASADDIKVKDLPAIEVAETKFHGPSSQIGGMYKEVNEWMEANSYEWAGPAMEIYTRKPKVIGNETILRMTVQVPIKQR